MSFESLAADGFLKILQKVIIRPHRSSYYLFPGCVGYQHANCLSDTPFYRVEAVTTVGNMGGAYIFTSWEEVIYSLGK